jgi:biotin carboxyl carrier protein
MNSNEEKEYLNLNGSRYQTRLNEKFKNRSEFKPADPNKLMSYIPGTVIEIFVSPGQKVKAGDLLLILDAMKMKNRVKCHRDATIKSVSVKPGDRLPKGVVMIELEE